MGTTKSIKNESKVKSYISDKLEKLNSEIASGRKCLSDPAEYEYFFEHEADYHYSCCLEQSLWAVLDEELEKEGLQALLIKGRKMCASFTQDILGYPIMMRGLAMVYYAQALKKEVMRKFIGKFEELEELIEEELITQA